ncbi:MAG: serpin family protein [Candidatus Merdivicinus sp.]|jgi:serine protease inhibitor
MKRKKWMAFCLSALLLTGCGNTVSAKISAGSGETASTAEPVRPEDDFVKAAADFAAVTASKVLSEAVPGQNYLYSPASLYLALAMTADTASGETQQQMLSLLGAEDADSLREDASNWYQYLCSGEEGTVEIAGSLWLNEGIPFHQEALDRLADSYDAYAYQMDFTSASLPKEVAAWVREATHGLLGDASDFQPEPDSALFLLSTLYFKGAWSSPFSEDDTETGDFIASNGTVLSIPFMQKSAQTAYVDGGNFAAASLSMQNGAVMTFILPDEGVSPAEVAADSDALFAAYFPENSEYGKVNFRVPKFDYSASVETLPEILQTLGMTDAFDGEQADFSILSSEPLFISNIRQEATLSIDEEGCEGAAYTQVSMNATAAMPPEQEFTLNLDRPFLFAVRYRDTILFTGIVENPSAS